MSEQEQARLKRVEQAVHELMGQFDFRVEIDTESAPEGYKERIIGIMLSALDALFAIRDGKEWRGTSDPQEIARQLLRDLELGD